MCLKAGDRARHKLSGTIYRLISVYNEQACYTKDNKVYYIPVDFLEKVEVDD